MSLLSSLYLFKFFEKINFNYDTVSKDVVTDWRSSDAFKYS